VLIASAILTYGGVSLFVVVFAIYPLAIALFREANVSRNLLPATIALGAFTFTMTAIPGTPQIQNLIPTATFKTNAMSGSIIEIVSGLIMAVGGYLWLAYRDKKLKAKNQGFTDPNESSVTASEEQDSMNVISYFTADCRCRDIKRFKMGAYRFVINWYFFYFTY